MDPNCISYWGPKLQAAGVRTPKTRIVTAHLDLWPLLDGQPPPEGASPWRDFLTELAEAAAAVGVPFVLRHGLGADKWSWSDSCFVPKLDRATLAQRVCRLVDWVGAVDLSPGPAWVWAVRRYVPLASRFTAWRGLPIAPERRYFIRAGEVVCHHAYWPLDAFVIQAECGCLPRDWPQLLAELNTETPAEVAYLSAESRRVARELGHGFWSLDWALGDDGHWWAVDMAEGARSWHPECVQRAKLPSGQAPVLPAERRRDGTLNI